MNNEQHLKQIEQAIDALKVTEVRVRPLVNSEILATYAEALTLLKEVEEGKAHVMRWVEMDVDKFYDNDEHEKLFTTDGVDLWVGSCDSIGTTEGGVSAFATFNNNNGEIPMPLTDTDVVQPTEGE